jgi:anaerobic selenocysteine-containing dehydrogenase
LVTVAGNPAVSTPAARRLDRALDALELMVSVDIYLNETTRHADVILPGESNLTRGHYDLAFTSLSCRNIANYSPPALEPEPGSMHEWEVLLRLTGIVTGQGPNADLAALDGFVARQLLERGLANPLSPAHGVDSNEAWSAVADAFEGPERLVDIMLRTGPYGDGFGRDPDGLSLPKLIEHPHGIDLGPLQPRIPEALRTPSGKIELAPDDVVADVERLRASLGRPRNGSMVLIGRRQLRSNNSWMHNLPALAGGANTCTLQIHPDDAAMVGVEDGKPARVTTSAGTVDVEVEVTDELRPGVVSLPHGWGDGNGDVRMRVASTQPAANSNVLSPSEVDPLSGNAILNGIAVTVSSI